jgi:hypothetical protein
LLEFDAASATVDLAAGAAPEPMPDDRVDGPSGTLAVTAPGVDEAGAPLEGETAGAEAAVADAGAAGIVADTVQDAEPHPSLAGDLGAAQSEPVDATPIAPWRPVFDHADDLGGVLQARSPLLSRAFGRRGRTPASSTHHDRSGTRGDGGDGHDEG